MSPVIGFIIICSRLFHRWHITRFIVLHILPFVFFGVLGGWHWEYCLGWQSFSELQDLEMSRENQGYSGYRQVLDPYLQDTGLGLDILTRSYPLYPLVPAAIFQSLTIGLSKTIQFQYSYFKTKVQEQKMNDENRPAFSCWTFQCLPNLALPPTSLILLFLASGSISRLSIARTVRPRLQIWLCLLWNKQSPRKRMPVVDVALRLLQLPQCPLPIFQALVRCQPQNVTTWL